MTSAWSAWPLKDWNNDQVMLLEHFVADVSGITSLNYRMDIYLIYMLSD